LCLLVPAFFAPSLCCCSEKSLEEFAAAVIDGTAEAEYKSAPIPDEPTDGGVSVIVGKNFDSIVKDAEKDVLLEVRTMILRICVAAQKLDGSC
jgi:hypothetical protein